MSREIGFAIALARDGNRRTEDPLEEKFWIFVDLGGERPDYYIAPGWWVENDIHKHHSAYLKKYGGQRKGGGTSQHHAIPIKRLLKWKDRWDALGIFGPT